MSFTFSMAAAISPAGPVDLGTHVGHERLGVLRLGEEADVVLQQGDLLFELAHLVVEALALERSRRSPDALSVETFSRKRSIERSRSEPRSTEKSASTAAFVPFLCTASFCLMGTKPISPQTALEVADHLVTAAVLMSAASISSSRASLRRRFSSCSPSTLAKWALLRSLVAGLRGSASTRHPNGGAPRPPIC